MFSYFFQKRRARIDAERILQEQRQRFNPLRNFDPDKLVSAIDAFRIGELGTLSRMIEELEERDDKMMISARKNTSALGRCPHDVLIVEGFEDDPRAQQHRDILRRFWANISVTSAFVRNEQGSLRLLKKQMTSAISRRYAVHEIVWQPLPNGEITASFIHVPNWFFENRTGKLRFLPRPGAYDGIPMPPGEWLVTVGDGVGIAAAVLAMSKRLSWNDWLLFSERCGQPGLHVGTDAAQDSEPWNLLVQSVRNFGREWSLITDNNTKLSPINLNTGANLPYPPLIEVCDKGIVTLYRGADLSTISGEAASGTGASVQGAETDLLEADAAELLSETLNAQVDRFVIRYVTGDPLPLAYLSIAPVDNPNIDQEIKVDNHLVDLGVKLSRNDALARYGRTAYDPAKSTNDEPLARQANSSASGAFWGSALHNARTSPATPLQNAATPLQNRDAGDSAPTGVFGDAALKTPSRAVAGGTAEEVAVEALVAARRVQLAPVIDRLLDALAEPDEAALQSALASLYADLPQLAEAAAADEESITIIADLLAEGFVAELENEQARGKSSPESNSGLFAATGGDGARPREGEAKKSKDSLGKKFHPDSSASYTTEDNRNRGMSALERALRQKADVKEAMYTPECGHIDFDWGTPGDKARDYAGGWGISHIAAKHPDDLKSLPDVIARGATYELPREMNESGKLLATRYAVVHEERVAFLDRRGKTGSFTVTNYTPRSTKLEEIKKLPLAKPRGA